MANVVRDPREHPDAILPDLASDPLAKFSLDQVALVYGPGSEHAAHPTRGNIINPAQMDYVDANDACIQCHSQGRSVHNPMDGKYYGWPVGYRVGLHLRDFWRLEEHPLGQTTFTHFADGTAHKNRMQGNDFVQSLMYRRGISLATMRTEPGTMPSCLNRPTSFASIAMGRSLPTAPAPRPSSNTPITRRARRAASVSRATCRRSRPRSGT